MLPWDALPGNGMMSKNTPITWHPPPTKPVTEADTVHLWRVDLDPSRSSPETLKRILTPEECRRAERYHFERDQKRFIIGRGMLRTILGAYLSLAPEKVPIQYTDKGKPFLGKGSNPKELRFNLSHSKDLALLAVSQNKPVGVDIEWLRSVKDLIDLAKRNFSPNEVEALQSLPEDQRTEGFFNCWTRKEAYLKAIGLGLTHPLEKVEVSLIPGKPAELLATGSEDGRANDWLLHALTPAPGYKAAVAAEGSDWQLCYWEAPTSA